MNNNQTESNIPSAENIPNASNIPSAENIPTNAEADEVNNFNTENEEVGNEIPAQSESTDEESVPAPAENTTAPPEYKLKNLSPIAKLIIKNKGVESETLLDYLNQLHGVLTSPSTIDQYLYNINASNFVHNNNNLSFMEKVEQDYVQKYANIRYILEKMPNAHEATPPAHMQNSMLHKLIMDESNTLDQRLSLSIYLKKQPLSEAEYRFYKTVNDEFINTLSAKDAFSKLKPLIENMLVNVFDYTPSSLKKIHPADFRYQLDS